MEGQSDLHGGRVAGFHGRHAEGERVLAWSLPALEGEWSRLTGGIVTMRIPDAIHHCVVFLGREGNYQAEYGATAFLARVEETVEDEKFTFLYAVTASHVAAKLESSGVFWIRANTRAGVEDFEVSLSRRTVWHHHADSSVDAAVCPLDHSVIRTPIAGIPVDRSMFLTRAMIEEHDIGIGDEVFITGLFTEVKGKARNLPIVRVGNLAMLPGEPVPTKKGRTEVYLIEARSIGGISGSPVFVRQTIGIRQSFFKWGTNQLVDAYASGTFFLLGLVHGHWEVDPESINDPYMWTDERDRRGVNLGIAIVVPAFRILEIFDQRELKEMREMTMREQLGKRITRTTQQTRIT
jgi:hypothetical protein